MPNTRRQAPLGPIGLRRKTDFEYLKDQGKVRYTEMASGILIYSLILFYFLSILLSTPSLPFSKRFYSLFWTETTISNSKYAVYVMYI